MAPRRARQRPAPPTRTAHLDFAGGSLCVVQGGEPELDISQAVAEIGHTVACRERYHEGRAGRQAGWGAGPAGEGGQEGCSCGGSAGMPQCSRSPRHRREGQSCCERAQRSVCRASLLACQQDNRWADEAPAAQHALLRISQLEKGDGNGGKLPLLGLWISAGGRQKQAGAAVGGKARRQAAPGQRHADAAAGRDRGGGRIASRLRLMQGRGRA